MDKIGLLREVRLFSGLKKKTLKTIADSCIERTYPEGHRLIVQGEPGMGLFIIDSGRVKVILEKGGEHQVELATMGHGDFFGELTVLDNAPRSASVIAVEETHCLLLTSWVFNAMMEAHPEIALEILPVVVSRFREATTKLFELWRL